MENEQADAGRDDRTRLARPKSQARTGTDSITYLCVVTHIVKSIDQPGKVANPARGQLNREN